MKKIFSFIVAAFMCFCMFTGCAYRDPNAERGQGNSGILDKIDVNLKSDYSGTLRIGAPDVQSHKNALNAFISSFNVKFPNIKVDVVYLDLNGYKQSIVNAAASAAALKDPTRMYDVFWLDQTYINEWVQNQDIISPLTSVINRDNKFSTDGINKQMLAMGSIGDKLYMMPRDYNQVVMYYNKDMFDAARVEYPSDTEEMSGEEFVAMVRTLANNLHQSTQTNDYGRTYREAVKYVIDCNVAWSSLDYPLVRSFGGEVVDESGKVVFDSPETLSAIRYWSELANTTVNSVKLAIDLSTGASQSGNQFRMQNSPIFLHARATMTDIINPVTIAGQEYKGVTNLGVAPLPNFGGTYAVGSGCSGYAMYTDCAHANEAYQFLKHVVSIEGQEAYSATGDCVPVLEELLNDLDAVWRNCRSDKLDPLTFNHDAFIHKMDTATCSVYDFYPNVPLSAQSYVTARIEEAFKSCIGDPKNMAHNLSVAAGAMKNDIAKA